MPLTEKGKKIMASMKGQYGEKKGEQVFYASRNKGIITDVEGPIGKHRKKRKKRKKAGNLTYLDFFESDKKKRKK